MPDMPKNGTYAHILLSTLAKLKTQGLEAVIFGIFGASAGLILVPSGGRNSIAELWIMIQSSHSPLFLKTKLPV